MPRPRGTINQGHSGILQELLVREKISQAELARRIHISPQTITSIRRGRANITQSTAEEIVKVFPQYCLNWLLGLSKYPTEEERIADAIVTVMHQLGKEEDAVEQLNAVLGYCADFPGDAITGDKAHGNIKTITFTDSLSDEEIIELVHQTPSTPFVGLTGPNGKMIRITYDKYQAALSDISSYARMRMRDLFEKEDDADGLDT